MNLRYKEDKKADKYFNGLLFLNLILGVVGLVLCFWPEPNRHWWLLLTGGALFELLLLFAGVINGDEAINGLRGLCEEQNEALKEKNKELELARRYREEFPDQSRVLEMLRDAGRDVREAYQAKGRLLARGLHQEDVRAFDNPVSVRELEQSFGQQRQQADNAISRAEVKLQHLHECALACHSEDVYPSWRSYAEPPVPQGSAK